MAEQALQDTGRIEDKISGEILRSRRVFLSDAVDMESANKVIRHLWYLEAVDPGKPILFIINSPGGSVDAGFAIWDQVHLISSPVTTLVTGLAASMGSLLCLCGGKGNRYITPHARVMIHQPSIHGVIRGQATDLEIQAREIIKTKKILVEVYHQFTGQPHEVIEVALDRDRWMGAQEAIDFGLVDKIASSFDDIKLNGL